MAVSTVTISVMDPAGFQGARRGGHLQGRFAVCDAAALGLWVLNLSLPDSWDTCGRYVRPASRTTTRLTARIQTVSLSCDAQGAFSHGGSGPEVTKMSSYQASMGCWSRELLESPNCMME